MVHISKNPKGGGFQDSSTGKEPQNGSRFGQLNINNNLGFGPQISPGFVSPTATETPLHLHREIQRDTAAVACCCKSYKVANPTRI